MGRHKPGRTYFDKTQTRTATSSIPRTTPTHSHKPVGHPPTASTDAHHTKQHSSRPSRRHRHHHCGTTHLYTNHNEETSDHQPTTTSNQFKNPRSHQTLIPTHAPNTPPQNPRYRQQLPPTTHFNPYHYTQSRNTPSPFSKFTAEPPPD